MLLFFTVCHLFTFHFSSYPSLWRVFPVSQNLFQYTCYWSSYIAILLSPSNHFIYLPICPPKIHEVYLVHFTSCALCLIRASTSNLLTFLPTCLVFRLFQRFPSDQQHLFPQIVMNFCILLLSTLSLTPASYYISLHFPKHYLAAFLKQHFLSEP